MAKRLQCYHPEIGDEIIPPFVVYGVANAEVGPLYCGLFRGSDWVEGTALHPPGDQSRWAFEFTGPISTGGGWSLWLGELADSMPMLQLYPLSIVVPFVAGQLTVKHPPQNRLIAANHVLSYGISSTPLNLHDLEMGAMTIPGTALRNAAGRFVVQFNAGVIAGAVNVILRFRNTDAPMPSQANVPVRLREAQL